MGTRLVSHRWLRDSKRSLEDVAVSWVIGDLQAEGLSLGDIWRPEREPNRRPELRRRPDCALTMDGRPAAIEATLFTTTAEGAGAARAEVVKTLLESRLNGAGLGPRSSESPSTSPHRFGVRARTVTSSATRKSWLN